MSVYCLTTLDFMVQICYEKVKSQSLDDEKTVAVAVV